MKNINFKYIHIALLPIAAIGVLGYSMTARVAAQILSVGDAIAETLVYGVSAGAYIINLMGADITPDGVTITFGHIFGFTAIALILFFWLTFLGLGWFLYLPQHKKPAIKTFKGWFLGIVYYPMGAFFMS